MAPADRRAALLEVGRTVFAECGFTGTSVEEVAARADVSKPVVYAHFGGKNGLYAAVVDGEVAALLQRFTAALTGATPRLLLEQATLALLGYVEERSDGFRILVREPPLPGGPGGATILMTVARRVEPLLAEAFSARGLPTGSAPLYAQALVGQVALVGSWWLSEPGRSRDDVARHLVNLAWNGLSHLQDEPGLWSR